MSGSTTEVNKRDWPHHTTVSHRRKWVADILTNGGLKCEKEISHRQESDVTLLSAFLFHSANGFLIRHKPQVNLPGAPFPQIEFSFFVEGCTPTLQADLRSFCSRPSVRERPVGLTQGFSSVLGPRGWQRGAFHRSEVLRWKQKAPHFHELLSILSFYVCPSSAANNGQTSEQLSGATRGPFFPCKWNVRQKYQECMTGWRFLWC